jgi:uncharacterized protein (TIGR02147 family)
MHISPHTSYREVLQTELLDRRTRRNGYSLRAFARDLQLAPPRLSEILKGNEGISEKTGEKIADALKLKPRQKKVWMSLVQKESARSPLFRSLAESELEKLKKSGQDRELLQDEFHLVSDWWHGALLELTQLEKFESSVSFCARELGLSAHVIEAALDRLERLGLLSRKDPKAWCCPAEANHVGGDAPNTAVRKLHRQLLEKSITALLNQPHSIREFNSVVLSIDARRLPELKEKLRKFLDDFCSENAEGEKNSLYSLGLQFFPVNKSALERTSQ